MQYICNLYPYIYTPPPPPPIDIMLNANYFTPLHERCSHFTIEICVPLSLSMLWLFHIFLGPILVHLVIYSYFFTFINLWYQKITPLSSKKSSNTFEIYMFNRSQTTRINQFEFLSTREGWDGSNLKYQILSLDITY